ncbi:MAG TPA: hypothetical protein VK779_07920, partial [Rhizomicrobium sp.]|nr:hypothetical protein [Rhizomicrobium sp.]
MRRPTEDSALVRYAFILATLGFFSLFVLLPLITVFSNAFANGVAAAWDALKEPDSISSIWLTIVVAAIAVPMNAVFGVAAAWAVTKHDFPGKNFLISLIDVPFSVSPVVSGLVYVLIFGMQGWLGPWLRDHDIKII